jgi:pilus assembly protein CpaF
VTGVLERQFLGAAASLIQWMENPSVTDLLINGTQSAFVEQKGSLEPIPNPFTDRSTIQDFIERLLIPLGRRVDAARPYLDGSLADGSRFHLILPPLAKHGPLISIRKQRLAGSVLLDSFGPAEPMKWLADAFRNGNSFLVSGGTGTGKTTLLACLLETLPADERILVVEETPEIRTRHPHAVFLESRPATPDGTGEVTLRTLIRNALRMRPSRLLLGECRGEEAWDLLQAMNTGHGGSACTLHANSPLDALRRLETLVLLAGIQAPLLAVREWIANAVQGVVQLERTSEGRKVKSLLQVCGLEGERYRVLPVWKREEKL